MAEGSGAAATASDSTTTTGAVDGSASDEGQPPGAGECTVTITGDREDAWAFEAGANRLGVATDYWFSEEAVREAIEEVGLSYDEFVESGEPLVSFLGIYCSESDDPMEPGAGVSIGATRATRAADLPMGPGSYPIIGETPDGPAGAMGALVSVPGEEIYETDADSGSLEITRWDTDGIEGSFSFTATEMFAEVPTEIEVAVEFSLVCETPGYTC